MRSDLVVVSSPSLDQHFRLLQRVKDFRVEQLVSEPAVEGLVVAILPRNAGLDEQRLHPDAPEPLPDGPGRELRAVVRPDVIGCPPVREQIGQ